MTFSSDISEVVVLQFVHAPPVTTTTTSPQPNTQGVFPGQVTVTLSATATAGFTIANTYYTVDGGAQRDYTASFTVSGEGTHTVIYWSVDDAGVYEIHQDADDHHRITSNYNPIAAAKRHGRSNPTPTTIEATGGTLPYHWSISSGHLPDGLNIDPDTGEISGTPDHGRNVRLHRSGDRQ